MNKHIYIIYSELVHYSFYFPESNMIDEDFFIEDRKYNILAVLGEKGACSLIVKNKNKVLFSTIFDANRIGIPSITFFFLLENEEYLQIGYQSEPAKVNK